MDWIIINVFVIFFGIALLIGLPMYFKKKNIIEKLKAFFEKYFGLV